MRLIEIKQRITALTKEARSLKTKSAKEKRFDQIRALSLKFGERLDQLFKEGETIHLDRELLCTQTFGGGGWGIKGEVKVLGVHLDSLVLASGDECFTVDLLSEGWSGSSLLGLTNVLLAKGEDQRKEDLESRVKSLERSLPSGIKLRNEIGKQRDGVRSQQHRDRVKREIKILRERRAELTSLSA